MAVRSTCYFGIKGLYASPELMGRTFTIDEAGSRVSFSIPTIADSAADSTWRSELPDRRLVGWSMKATGVEGWQEVLVIRAVIETDSVVRVSEQAAPDQLNSPAQMKLTEDLARAASLLRETLERLRVSAGQYWLGMSGQSLPVLWSQLVDGEGDNLGHGPAPLDPAGKARFGISDGVTTVDFEEALAHAAAGDVPSLPDSLVVDAHYLIWESSHQYREALLLAAIAAEAAVKQTLEAIASESQRNLVVLLFKSPRDYSMAAVALFDKPMKATVGRSLREEDKTLYAAVDALFQDRNRIAHSKGGTIEKQAVIRHVETASKAIGWLRGVQSSAG